MVSRYVVGVLGALVLGADAISTRPYWNATRTTVCADNCWSTTTLYPECTEATSYVTTTEWSTTTIWGENETYTTTYTQPASTLTSYITVTEGGSTGSSSLVSSSSSSNSYPQGTPSTSTYPQGTPSISSYPQGTPSTSQPSQVATTVTAYVTTSIYVVSDVPGPTETDWKTWVDPFCFLTSMRIDH